MGIAGRVLYPVGACMPPGLFDLTYDRHRSFDRAPTAEALNVCLPGAFAVGQPCTGHAPRPAGRPVLIDPTPPAWTEHDFEAGHLERDPTIRRLASDTTTGPARDPVAPTPREREALQWAAAGKTEWDICDRMSISEHGRRSARVRFIAAISIVKPENAVLYSVETLQAYRLRHQVFVEDKRWADLARPDGREIDTFDADRAPLPAHRVSAAALRGRGPVEPQGLGIDALRRSTATTATAVAS